MKTRTLSLALILSLLAILTPKLQAQWVQTNGPYGVEVLSFTANGATIFAGTHGAGAYRSTDYGASWIAVNVGLTSSEIWALAIIGTDIFAGTLGGVFRSTNNGDSWTAINPSISVKTLVVSDSSIFAGTFSNGLYLSTDKGMNWHSADSGITTGAIYAIALNGTNLFVGTFLRGVFHSTDNGTSWKAVNNGLSTLDIYSMAVSGTNIFAGADGEGIFRSTDSGKSWIVANTGLPNITISSLLASGSNLYAGTNGDGVYLSTNEGVSWSATGSITGGFVNALAESNANLFAGTDAGASLSKNDGITWTTINTGLVNTGIGLLASIGDNLYAATTYGVFRTTDNGLSWIAQNNGLKSIDVHALAVNDTNLLAGTSAGVWRLTASSVSWSNAGLTGNYIGALAETGNSLYAGTDNSSQPSGGVYLSTDKGTNWTATSNGLPSDIAVYGLAAIGTNLFVDFIIPEPNQVEQIYVSTDSGANWASTGFSSGVGPSAAISDNLFVTWNNNGVFRSTDDGISWSSVNTGLTDRKVYALLVSGTTLFAGTNSGLFFSTDNGDDWTMANSGLMTAIYAIAATTSNLFVGAVSGVWRRPLSDFSAVTTVNPTKPSFTTYPNPFSNRTTINFTSTESGVVEISIVNILGAEVARLFSGELAAGAHSYSWNADGMPAGSYFCILRSSKGVQELPIALLR